MKAPIFALLAAALVALAIPPATADDQPISFSNDDFKDLPDYDPGQEALTRDDALRAVEERRRATQAGARISPASSRPAAVPHESPAFDDAAVPDDPTSSDWVEGTDEQRARLKAIIGRPAAPLSSVKDWFNTEPIDISKSKGKIFLLTFWSVDHELSKSSVPIMNALQDRYRDAGVVVIGICGVDDRAGKPREEIVKEMGIRYPAGWDAGNLCVGYEVDTLPDYAIVGHDGNVFAADLRDNAVEPALRAAIARRDKGK